MKAIIIGVALAVTALALPQPPANLSGRGATTPDPRSIAIVTAIAPTSTSCDNAPAAGECATAAQAIQPMLDSFTKYKIGTMWEQAALISWMAFESGDFKYDKNHYPGRPGQGTRNMMMPSFVAEYAAAAGVKADSDPATQLQNVIAAGLDFGSAAWYYSTKCTDAQKKAVQAGGIDGWHGFLTGCVQTTLDDKRDVSWKAAVNAMGGQA